MSTQEQINFNRIAEAIGYIQQNFKEQPNLDIVAEKVHLSPFHFQRMFSEWAGTTPKKFLQYISVEHAKRLLKMTKQFVQCQLWKQVCRARAGCMICLWTLRAWLRPSIKMEGRHWPSTTVLPIVRFGSLIVASTSKGVCAMAFHTDELQALDDLRQKFPNASFNRRLDLLQQRALFIFQNDWQAFRKNPFKRNRFSIESLGSVAQNSLWASLAHTEPLQKKFNSQVLHVRWVQLLAVTRLRFWSPVIELYNPPWNFRWIHVGVPIERRPLLDGKA